MLWGEGQLRHPAGNEVLWRQSSGGVIGLELESKMSLVLDPCS